MLPKLIENIDRLMTMCVPMQYRTAWIEAKSQLASNEELTENEVDLLLEDSMHLLSCVTSNNPANVAADKLHETAKKASEQRLVRALAKLEAEEAAKKAAEELAASIEEPVLDQPVDDIPEADPNAESENNG